MKPKTKTDMIVDDFYSLPPKNRTKDKLKAMLNERKSWK